MENEYIIYFMIVLLLLVITIKNTKVWYNFFVYQRDKSEFESEVNIMKKYFTQKQNMSII